MSFRQLVSPNLGVVDGAGWCLRFTQSVWGAPARYESAWYAWTATQKKHSAAEPLPEDAGVVVWFSHYGTYGNPPRYDNWGHVVSWIPGSGFLSSPTSGTGQKWLATIQDVERTFNSTYVGWSEDINGLQVAEYYDTPTPTPTRKRKKMGAFYRTPDGGIMYQDKPNTAFTAIDLPTWLAYSANGNVYSEVSQSDMARLVARFGTY